MHNTLKSVFIGVAGIFLLVGNGFCEGIEQGEIVESIPEAGLIQVNNHIFKVGQVTVLTEEKEYPGDIRDLKEGGIVRIIVGEKTEKQWEADLVTLYYGEMALKAANEIDVPESSLAEKEVPRSQPVKSGDTSVLRLKNGVWQN